MAGKVAFVPRLTLPLPAPCVSQPHPLSLQYNANLRASLLIRRDAYTVTELTTLSALLNHGGHHPTASRRPAGKLMPTPTAATKRVFFAYKTNSTPSHC